MPIDPSIPLSVNPPPMQSPFALLGDLAQLQAIRAQAGQRAAMARAAEQRAQTEQLKAQTAERDAAIGRSIKGIDLKTKQSEYARMLIDQVDDDTSWQAVRPMVVANAPDLGQVLPQHFDRALLDRMLAESENGRKMLAVRREALTDFQEGKSLRGVANLLATVDSTPNPAQVYTDILKHARETYKVDDATLGQFDPMYSPQAVARAAQLALTPSERTTQAEKAPKVGSFEDYVLRFAQAAGKTPQQLSPTDIEAARKRYQQADDRQPKITVNTGNASDVSETVAGMMDGSLPPIMPGRATKEYTALMAESHRKGFDLAAAATDWAATQKHVATLNNAQQTRLGQNIDNAAHSLDVIEDLASQWKGGKFPLLNKARLTLAVGGALGPKAQQIATQLQTQIADVTTELGNVYMGGNSPTDHALGLAAKNLAAEWAEGQLESNVTLARRNLKIRQNSMRNSGVAGASANNPYAPSSPASGTAEEWVRDASGKLVKKAK